MELTYLGRARSLVLFCTGLNPATPANSYYIGQFTPWPSTGIAVFDPNGMAQDAVSMSSKGLTITPTYDAVKPDVNGIIEYAGGKYTKLCDATVNNLNTIAGDKSFLLYLQLDITNSSGSAVEFRQIGLDKGSGVEFYQNIPVQSVTSGGTLTLKVIFAF